MEQFSLADLIGTALIVFALGGLTVGGFIYFKDRDYQRHLRCAGCQKKMFSIHQDDMLSDREVQQRLERLRYRVSTGQVTEHIQ